MRACLILNPAARGEKARRFLKFLRTLGSELALKPTIAPEHGRTLAAEAVCEGFDTIVAGGGDGTVNEVLNGIGDAPGGFARARLAVLPLGTTNVFARELGMPLQLPAAWTTIRAGRERVLDLPFAEFTRDGRPQRRYFAQMAGAGLDSRAIELVDWEHKKRIAQFAYIIAGWRAVRGSLATVRCECSGGQAASGQQVMLGNGRFYGGPLDVFHRARNDDGLFDVCVFPCATVGTVLRYATGYVTGRVFPPPDMRYFQAESVTLTSESRVSFEVEGDLAGELPVTFRIVPRGLRVIGA